MLVVAVGLDQHVAADARHFVVEGVCKGAGKGVILFIVRLDLKVVAASDEHHQLRVAHAIRVERVVAHALHVGVAVQVDVEVERLLVGQRGLLRAHIGGGEVVQLVVGDIVDHFAALRAQKLRQFLAHAHYAVRLIVRAPCFQGLIGVLVGLLVGFMGVRVVNEYARRGLCRRHGGAGGAELIGRDGLVGVFVLWRRVLSLHASDDGDLNARAARGRGEDRFRGPRPLVCALLNGTAARLHGACFGRVYGEELERQQAYYQRQHHRRHAQKQMRALDHPKAHHVHPSSATAYSRAVANMKKRRKARRDAGKAGRALKSRYFRTNYTLEALAAQSSASGRKNSPVR